MLIRVRRCILAVAILLACGLRPGWGEEAPAPASTKRLPQSTMSAPPPRRDAAVSLATPTNADGLLLAQNAAGNGKQALSAPTGQPTKAAPEISEAERIARLQRNIETDSKALAEIQAQLADPEAEYRKAEAEFQQLDSLLEEAKQIVAKLHEENRKQEAEALKPEIAKAEEKWKLAKDRFEIAIQERKTSQEQLETLTSKIKQERAALDKLTGVEPAATEAAQPAATGSQPAVAPPATGQVVTPPPANASPAGTSVPADAQPPAESQPAAESAAATPAAAALPGSSLPAANAAAAPGEAEKPLDKELQAATEDAQAKEAAAQTAEQEAQSVGERMKLLQKGIDLERKLLNTARKKADNAEASQAGLEEEYRTKASEGGDAAALRELQTRIADARRRFREARTEGRERAARLDELQSRYAALQSEQLVAMRQADEMRKEADTAKDKVDQLRNPFTARNTLQWLIDHGPRIFLILIAMAVALGASRVFERRIVNTMVKRGGLGKRAERENRARTLVSVFHNAGNVAVIGGGTLMILDIIGAPITALMGGAAVFGLAVAFGAQNLIKDYFYGFMILMEQQYTINDVVRIGEIAGQVERITLRMTVLRDLEGRVHFIPHGQITSTTNMTHGWSRAVFDVGVAYKEDVDRVIATINDVGRQLRDDPTYAPLILDDLTMLGLDALGDSAVVIKFFIKTRPLKQWEIKREMLRRIKRTFDEQGIEIPFPHRTVFHRHEGAEGEATPEQYWAERKSA